MVSSSAFPLVSEKFSNAKKNPLIVLIFLKIFRNYKLFLKMVNHESYVSKMSLNFAYLVDLQ